jgi:hypothetical protein
MRKLLIAPGVIGLLALTVCSRADDKDKAAKKSPDGAMVLDLADGKLAVTNVQNDKRWTFKAPQGEILAAEFAPKGFKTKWAPKGSAIFWASATHLGALDADGKEAWRFKLVKETLPKASLSFALNKEIENKRWNLVTVTGGETPLHFEMETGRLVLRGED